MIIKILTCIPCYNNDQTIVSIIESCIKNSQMTILVVDDGSDRPILELIKESGVQIVQEALASKKLEVIRQNQNQGKGFAIQTAIKWATARGFTHLLTLDGDGQHLPSEISKFTNKIKENPWDMIIGSRIFQQSDKDIPEISKFGRKFSNFWVKFETGTTINDSQSGFRAYPLFHVQCMNFLTKKFDFEVEVLVRLLWNNVRIQEIDIEVFYPSSSERVSHFNKFSDNVRISLLNTLLVAVSLFRAGFSPFKLSLALGIGVFVGCTPFFGLHSLIIILLSIVLRLNVVIAWIGTQISIPPLAPLLAYCSLMVGHYFFGTELELNLDNITIEVALTQFKTYLTGSLLFGLGCGLFTSIIVYLIAKTKLKTVKKNNWTGKSRGGAFGNWFIKKLITSFGVKAGYFCLLFIVPYFYLFAPKAVKASKQYWRVTKPDSNFFSLHFMILKHFYTFGCILLDELFQSSSSKSQFPYKVVNKEDIAEVIKNKEGLIFVGFHFGGWKMSAYHLKDLFVNRGMHVVQHGGEQENSPVDQSIFGIKKSLDDHIPVSFMIDRPLGNQFELVPFMGKIIPVDIAPFKIALTMNAYVSSFSARKEKDGYVYCSTTPKKISADSSINSIVQIRECLLTSIKEIESEILKTPEQWLSFYKTFSSRPDFSIKFSDKKSTVRKEKYYLEEELR